MDKKVRTIKRRRLSTAMKNKIQVIPNPHGRESLYNTSYCDLIIERMKDEGISICEFAAEIGVSRQTIRNWRNNYEEFDEACIMAIDYARAWWEKLGRDWVIEDHKNKDGMHYKKKMNINMYMQIMKNRFGWADKMDSKTLIGIDEESIIKVNENKSIGEITEAERNAKIIDILVKSGKFLPGTSESPKTETE